jgi:hypothetical protein
MMAKQGTRPTERAERAIGRRLLQRRGVSDVLARNSLSLTMFALFLLLLWGQSVAGHRTYNEDRRDHGRPPIGYVSYLTEGHFIEAVFENWESEFLQMGAFVVFTVFLRQRGSPESKKLVGREPEDKARTGPVTARTSLGRCAAADSSSGSTRTRCRSRCSCCSSCR